MCWRLKTTTTCDKLLRERQYFVSSDFNEQIQSKLHLCMRTVKHKHVAARSHGMIYTVNFDPTGTYLVATCSGNSFFLYDPRFNRVVCSNPCAHEDGVNCATFLAPGRFATGSADGNVALWDARKVTSPVTLLKGHTNGVEDVEYDERSNLLFTIGFDSQVLCWDLGGIREPVSKEFDLIMRLPHTYRLKLAPDNSKLLLTTQYSCLIVINNFNGHTIVRDMQSSMEVVSKIAKSFYYNRSRAFEMLQRDESQFLTRKKNAVSFHLAPPVFSKAMSVCFHPGNNNFIAYRTEPRHNLVETTCLYDIRDTQVCCDSQLSQYYKDFPSRRALAVKDYEYNGVDFIKEISFSPDGRLVADPSSNTVKLLAATSECPMFDLHFRNPMENASCPSEFCDLQCPLSEHQSPVLCCAFAPRDVLLATGCMDGEICIHQPVL